MHRPTVRTANPGQSQGRVRPGAHLRKTRPDARPARPAGH